MSFISLLGLLACTSKGKSEAAYETENFPAENGSPVTVALIKHGSLAISWNGLSIQVDPVAEYGKHTDYATEFPKADIILLTHEHQDHFDKNAIEALKKPDTKLFTNEVCAQALGWGTALANGDKVAVAETISLEAVPAYNTTEGHTQFHPKGRDNGFILSLGGFRIYIAGDTEDIPEMEDIKDIDVAFLPVNQPYTMTVEQCVRAAKTISPKVLIPYHFSDTDLSSLPEQLPGITVLLRQMQ